MNVIYLDDYDCWVTHPSRCQCTFCKINRQYTEVQISYLLKINRIALNPHMPFRCELCGYHMGSGQALREHKNNHHSY